MWTGRIHWKRRLLKTIAHVISVPTHFHLKKSKVEDTEKQHAQCKLHSVFRHLYRFSCGRAKRFEK